MNVRPSILCPIDFSDASAGALRYAAAIADHFATRLIVLAVEDPLLTRRLISAPASSGSRKTPSVRLRHFADEDVRRGRADRRGPGVRGRRRQAAARDPAGRARTLVRSDRDQLARAHRRAQAVLRVDDRTRAAGDDAAGADHAAARPGPDLTVDDAKRLLGRIVVPVDLSPASTHQTQVARALAEALGSADPRPRHRAAEDAGWRRGCTFEASSRPPGAGRGRPERAAGDRAAPASGRGADRLRRSRRGSGKGGARSSCRPDRDGAARLAAARAADGLRHLPAAVPVALAGPRSAADDQPLPEPVAIDALASGIV